MFSTIKRIVDLTQPLYHDHPCPGVLQSTRMRLIFNVPRDGFNLEEVITSTHLGTHVDAPYHFIDTGQRIDAIALDRFMGPGIPIDLRHKGRKSTISRDDLLPHADRITKGSIPLLCSGWGLKRAITTEYLKEQPQLSEDGARWLVERGVRGVGYDHFMLGGTEAHLALLGAGVWIAEELLLPPELFDLPEWFVVCLPLRVRDGSGAQARIVAIQFES